MLSLCGIIFSTSMIKKQLSPQQACDFLNISYSTLLRWEEKGMLVAHRSASNRRYYTKKQLDLVKKGAAKAESLKVDQQGPVIKTFRLDQTLVDALSSAASKEGVTSSDLLRRILVDYFHRSTDVVNADYKGVLIGIQTLLKQVDAIQSHEDKLVSIIDRLDKKTSHQEHDFSDKIRSELVSFVSDASSYVKKSVSPDRVCLQTVNSVGFFSWVKSLFR